MIRAIVGTLAVLAAFAVVETASDASTGPAGSCKATEAYALLQPGRPLPVRATPTPEGRVLGVLASKDGSRETVRSVVTLTGSRKGWARIALQSGDYAAIGDERHAYGWMPADLLAVNTRVDGAITVYNRPGFLGDVIGRIENENQTFRILGCRGTLLQVINAKEGDIWIDRWCARSEGCRG